MVLESMEDLYKTGAITEITLKEVRALAWKGIFKKAAKHIEKRGLKEKDITDTISKYRRRKSV